MNWKSFLIGFIIGAVVAVGVLAVVGIYMQKAQYSWYNEPGKSIDLVELYVTEVVGENAAIACGKRLGDKEYNYHQKYLLFNSVGHSYYNNEIIEVPDTLDVVQLGTFKYVDEYGETNVIPIIGRMNTGRKKQRELGGFYSSEMKDFDKNAVTMVEYSTESIFPTISLKNNLEKIITSANYRIIYYDMSGEMQDYNDFSIKGVIDSHMTKEYEIQRYGNYNDYYYKSKPRYGKGKPYKISFELQSYEVDR